MNRAVDLSDTATRGTSEGDADCSHRAREARGRYARKRVRQGRAALSALVALTSVCGAARSDPARLDLEFRAPAECGSAEQVQSAVAALVRSERPPLKAVLEIEHVDALYVANVRTEPGAQRQLVASSCRAVMEAASVVLALAIDPNGAPPAAQAPPTRKAKQERVDPISASHRSFQPLFVAELAADSSTLPSSAIGGRLGAGLVGPRWSASLQFTSWYPQDAELSASPARGGHFTWWTGGLSLCAAPFAPAWVEVCLSPEIGRLAGSGSGAGVPQRTTAAATWLAIGLGPALEWRFSANWGLRGAAVADVTVLGRHPFIVSLGDSTLLVHQPGRLSARTYLGITARF
jgi:hypothetical protein